MNNDWHLINTNILYYLEYNVLPSLLAYAIAYSVFKGIRINNFNMFYNDVKSYINISNENKNTVIFITKNILKNKYDMVIISYQPLTIKKVK